MSGEPSAAPADAQADAPIGAPGAEFDADALEAGRLLFARPVAFRMGVARIDQLPPADRPEIAFAGRSNVGKSSLVNAVTGRKQLARASAEPGRTRELNFFDVAEGRLNLVDLPGYGFARAPRKDAAAWSRLTMDYLRGRPTLRRVFLLIDSRRGPGGTDAGVMDALDAAAVSYQLVLTKTDKLKAAEIAAVKAASEAFVKKRPAAHPQARLTSSETGAGVAELRAAIAMLAG
jgi:GTP-binding protein